MLKDHGVLVDLSIELIELIQNDPQGPQYVFEWLKKLEEALRAHTGHRLKTYTIVLSLMGFEPINLDHKLIQVNARSSVADTKAYFAEELSSLDGRIRQRDELEAQLKAASRFHRVRIQMDDRNNLPTNLKVGLLLKLSEFLERFPPKQLTYLRSIRFVNEEHFRLGLYMSKISEGVITLLFEESSMQMFQRLKDQIEAINSRFSGPFAMDSFIFLSSLRLGISISRDVFTKEAIENHPFKVAQIVEWIEEYMAQNPGYRLPAETLRISQLPATYFRRFTVDTFHINVNCSREELHEVLRRRVLN